MHTVPWPDATFESIGSEYVKYVKDTYGSDTIVVFDGYTNNRNSVKAQERTRRTGNKSCPIVRVAPNLVPTAKREEFLSNMKNKAAFINFLSSQFRASNIESHQAEDDADLLIVKKALELNCRTPVIVAQDTDIVVLTIALTSKNQTIYLLKPGKSGQEKELYSSRSLDNRNFIRDHILFLHAFTGCDTVSAIYRRTKNKIIEKIETKTAKDEKLREAVSLFTAPNLSQEKVIELGNLVFLAIYDAPKKNNTLNDLRYSLFVKGTRKNKAVSLLTLPPTDDAAAQHSLRTYYQVQTWLGNNLLAVEWGWKFGEDTLEPVKMTNSPAPSNLLELIFCNCKKGCTGSCSCRKAGLKCTEICGSCTSNNPCQNLYDEVCYDIDLNDDSDREDFEVFEGSEEDAELTFEELLQDEEIVGDEELSEEEDFLEEDFPEFSL